MPVSPLLEQVPVTIGDLANEVIIRCENRQNDVTRAWVWVRDALLEITTHTDYRDDFDELEIWGTPFALTPNVQEYQFSNFLPTGDDPITQLPVTYFNMATLSVLIATDPPDNTRWLKLNPTHYQDTDRATTPPGGSQPAEWYRFADTIGFNPTPQLAYLVKMRILRMHPINDDGLPLTVILLNRDWHEIIVWMAVERGYMEMLEFDKAAAIHQLLHGDPRYDKPGILNGAKKRRKREAWRQQSSLRPIMRPYGYGRG